MALREVFLKLRNRLGGVNATKRGAHRREKGWVEVWGGELKRREESLKEEKKEKVLLDRRLH